tara:strand:- start:203 stop:1069 length:867 start_codon:yes stop_codon:yes gene_type:complete
MKNVIGILLISLFMCFGSLAKTLEQKKTELKKIYEAGGISKVEYYKAFEFLEEPEKKEKKKEKRFLSLKKKKDEKNSNNPFKKKDKDLEKITLEKINELGKPVQFDDSYFMKGMIEKLRGCNNSFKCRGGKAGQELFKTFNKSKSYSQQNPGKMIKAMAWFEVFYASKLWTARKSLERFKENNYKKGIFTKKTKDEKEIQSLFGINKGRQSMRAALGMNSKTPTKEAIKKFWLLGEFLDLGTGVKNEKLDKDLKERQELLEAYKVQIANLKKKLQDDIDKEENEKSLE